MKIKKNKHIVIAHKLNTCSVCDHIRLLIEYDYLLHHTDKHDRD